MAKKATTAKDFATYIKSKGMSDQQVKEFIDGKRFRILNATGGHNYGQVGSIFTAEVIPGATLVNRTNGSWLKPGGNGINWVSLQLVNPQTVAEIKEEMARLEGEREELRGEIDDLQGRIKFMQANSLEEFDEDQFKVYQVLQTLKGKKSDIEKAKVIAELVKN